MLRWCDGVAKRHGRVTAVSQRDHVALFVPAPPAQRRHLGIVMTHMLCWGWAMYFSAANSSENDHGSMNLAL
jgi:hypothetical protein